MDGSFCGCPEYMEVGDMGNVTVLVNKCLTSMTKFVKTEPNVQLLITGSQMMKVLYVCN